MKKSTLIVILIAMMAALTALTTIGLYLFINYCEYIAAIVIGVLYPVGIIAGISTIKYELED